MSESLFIKKQTLTQVFSCVFCEIFKNNFFIEHLRWLLLDDLMYINIINIERANKILVGDEYATLPSNVKPDIFPQVAFNNVDNVQETNSRHITNTTI